MITAKDLKKLETWGEKLKIDLIVPNEWHKSGQETIESENLIITTHPATTEEYFKHHYKIDIHEKSAEDGMNNNCCINACCSSSCEEEIYSVTQEITNNLKERMRLMYEKDNKSRVEEWKEFSKKVEEYITSVTVDKYGTSGNDLVSLTDNPRIWIWNILKYALRVWRNNGKINDIFKIVHYAQIAYTQSNGDYLKLGITNYKST